MAHSVAASLLPGMVIQQRLKRFPSVYLPGRPRHAGPTSPPRRGAGGPGYFLQSNATSSPAPAAMSNDCSGLARTASSSVFVSWPTTSRPWAESWDAEVSAWRMASCAPSLRLTADLLRPVADLGAEFLSPLVHLGPEFLDVVAHLRAQLTRLLRQVWGLSGVVRRPLVLRCGCCPVSHKASSIPAV